MHWAARQFCWPCPSCTCTHCCTATRGVNVNLFPSRRREPPLLICVSDDNCCITACAGFWVEQGGNQFIEPGRAALSSPHLPIPGSGLSRAGTSSLNHFRFRLIARCLNFAVGLLMCFRMPRSTHCAAYSCASACLDLRTALHIHFQLVH
jgi:hypothetical protein